MKYTKIQKRRKIKARVRKKISGTPSKPRLSVFRSNKSIYCQLIDDINGQTLASASSTEKGTSGANKTEEAKSVGKVLAERAKANNIENIVFDRNGYLYHGRVKALAEGVREGGIQF